MDFYHRDTTADNGVSQRYRRMCVTTGIQDHRSGTITHRPMQSIDQYTLAVGLKGPEINSPSLSPVVQGFIDLGERNAAIDLRLATTQEVEVGTV